MSDLISRKALLQAIDQEREYLKERGLLGAEHVLVHNFTELVKNAPAIETPTGCWANVKNNYISWYVCNKCGSRPSRNYLGDEFLSDYCPNCGANMKGGNDNECIQ